MTQEHSAPDINLNATPAAIQEEKSQGKPPVVLYIFLAVAFLLALGNAGIAGYIFNSTGWDNSLFIHGALAILGTVLGIRTGNRLNRGKTTLFG